MPLFCARCCGFALVELEVVWEGARQRNCHHDRSIRGAAFIVNKREKVSRDISKSPEQRKKRNRLAMARAREAR